MRPYQFFMRPYQLPFYKPCELIPIWRATYSTIDLRFHNPLRMDLASYQSSLRLCLVSQIAQLIDYASE
jgi:hypothetical protein